MDEPRNDLKSGPRRDAPISRRAFFGRTFAIAGGTAAVLSLTACPGGDGDDDDGDDEDDD
ncbi:hypothetical protein O7635_08125 [Asanoa sp. WMMD1127]|uniref:hypothetical protein n=1 Tax=Asanoa sp. WMMD1127 TaxID=3016107 RepID=UPI002415BE83|nr:hypothetical protein [Asanoa sp. WMMD1127]MDG4821819.1 hypothetical protein [Asanoa sp. WMMD1127]